MKLGGRELGLGKSRGGFLNKVSISTITTGVPTGVPTGPRVRGIGDIVDKVAKVIKVEKGAAEVKIVSEVGAVRGTPAGPGEIRVVEVPPVEEKEEYVGEGLTSPW